MLAVCAIVKDEPVHYAEEWLEWHRRAGVDRFFIYDQGGWALTGKDIIVRSFPGKRMQLPAYNHCLRDCDGADYLAFIDMDEFMMGPVKERLNSVENALALNWKVYGTSGLKWSPSGRQMGVFMDYVPADRMMRQHVKVVVRPDRTVRMPHAHFGEYVRGGSQEAFDGTRFFGMFNGKEMKEYPEARLNHYITRSEEDWKTKVAMGRVSMTSMRRPEGVLVVDHCCVESDGPVPPRPGSLPRVVEAWYGVPGFFADVTEKFGWMAERGWVDVCPGRYNEFFGDPVPGRPKRLRVRFERAGSTVGELDVSENETLFLP